MNNKMKIKVNYKDLKMETIYKVISAVLTALLLVVTVSLVIVTKDNQKQIKGLQERIETISKNNENSGVNTQGLKDSQITRKYMVDDDCLVEVWDAQFKTLRSYTVEFDEWEHFKVGEIW
jgi:hypothetical protein|nr:MAG TPA: protein of unknown function (DUF4083) [Caudoviricetes sp.]